MRTAWWICFAVQPPSVLPPCSRSSGRQRPADFRTTERTLPWFRTRLAREKNRWVAELRKRGSGKQWGEGERFRLADEVRYLQNKAAEHDGRVVALGQLVLFSTDTGGAWLLDGTDQLAARRARDGDPEPIHLEQSDYQLRYRMERALSHRGPRLHLPRS